MTMTLRLAFDRDPTWHAGAVSTLAQTLRHWASVKPDATAYTFLVRGQAVDSISYRELDRAAIGLGSALAAATRPGARVMLMLGSGLTFIVAFFACQYAGVVPVPIPSLRNKRLRDATTAIARDCGATVCLVSEDVPRSIADELDGATPDMAIWPLNDWTPFVDDERGTGGAFHPAHDTAFIQYTSGSTSLPKGVVVRQANVLSNLAMQCDALRSCPGVIYVGWAPFYHDMGLIGNILQPLYMGGHSVLMAPGDFARDPTLWMRAISEYRAQVSGGPNYAYDLCIKAFEKIRACEVDLSCWEVAFNSGEPVRANTVETFSARFAALGLSATAMYPCYGMAEATLMISGKDPAAATVVISADKAALAGGRLVAPTLPDGNSRLVGCGHALAGESIAIVAPHTRQALPHGMVGEIWVTGSHVPERYWENEAASRDTFHAHIEGDETRTRYLRTGDLGVMRDNELFVVGRLKDVIIVRGRNYYPQDIERIAEQASPAARAGSNAAFSVDGPHGEERVVLVQEIERASRRNVDTAELAAHLRRAIFDEYELSLFDIVFIEPGTIPKTSSGKIKRRAARESYLADTLARVRAATPTALPA
ncbi:fatty acyl-AMP ligase [Trinickia sp. LjRoot230]|uniref:fatty acyl-AMP ligase n=1 Tax=Trinickia sp. LjRoot230 TaxID=3342288 RepID=UPI003ECD67A8